ncbi:MAG: MBL fold metallo-hydrolase [Erysipelotrichaceae bacterium]|nr:MBL fold metallo-hydrolase [Erysipelotrichaceae bacterium]
MELFQLDERIYYSAYEEERDRPALGYLLGDDYSIAIDAGHSDDHVKEFYEELNKRKLPLPSLTIITHWHWDHSFAMHAINGLSIADKKTDDYLKDFIEKRTEESDKLFLELDPSIALEYKDNKPIIVRQADIVFEGSLHLNAGNLKVEAFEAVSPHTDDATLIMIPEHRTVFFGDAMSGVFPSWITDQKLLDGFIETIEAIDADHFIGGHWPIFTKQELLAELKNR